MERLNLHILIYLVLPASVWCQQNNFELHKGNELFKSGKYEQATGYYDKALTKDPSDYRAQYNLGNSLFRTERYEEAEQHYQQVSTVAPSSQEQARALHNLGNVYMLQKKLDPAIEAYKNALRENPRDEATRYNLAYAMQLKQQQEKNNQQQQKQNQNQQKKNNDQNQDQNKENQNKQDDNNKEDQQKGDQQEDKEDQKQDQNKQNQDQGDKKEEKKKQQPQSNQISKEQAKRMLDAINKVEKGVKKKVDEDEAKEKAIVNEEKDW